MSVTTYQVRNTSGQLTDDDIKYLSKRKIKCLCIGEKTSKDKVRCLELDDGNYISPQYGNSPSWSETDNKDYIFVEPKFFVPRAWTRNTAYQCWSTRFDSISVTDEIWKTILSNWLCLARS